MNSKMLNELFEENNNILVDNYGEPTCKKQGNVSYDFSWGKLQSYLDIKTGDAGIVVLFE